MSLAVVCVEDGLSQVQSHLLILLKYNGVIY